MGMHSIQKLQLLQQIALPIPKLRELFSISIVFYRHADI
jgi:hypothetical protein